MKRKYYLDKLPSVLKRHIPFFTLFPILVLSGCLMGPNFRQSQYTGPAQYRFTESEQDSAAIIRWWEVFQDPTLDTLISIALSKNKDVLKAASVLEAARANIHFVQSDQKPTISYGTGVSASGFNSNTSSDFYLAPQLQWEIGFWGKYRRLNEAAQADALSTEYAMRAIQSGLISAVASTYFSILAHTELLRISERTLATRDSGLILMRGKYEGGLIALIDYNQAKIQRDLAAAAVPTYERIIEQNKNAMFILLGEWPRDLIITESFRNKKYELDIPVGLPSQLLERRPDIRQTEEQHKAANAQIGVAEALRWPSLNLTASLGLASPDLVNLNAYGLTWSAGSSLFGPLFQYGKNKRRVEIAYVNARTALLQYEATVQQAFREVEDALVAVQTFKKELMVQESRTITALESEHLAQVRYSEGSTTYLEVLEQQRQSFSAQLDLASNRLDLVKSYITLYKALGGGWLRPEEEQQFKDTNQQ